MTIQRRGRVLRLSPARRMVLEIMRQGQRVPSLPQAKDVDVASLVIARRQSPIRPSWLSVFLRAYGLAGRRHPELRRAYIRWPYPRLYEHFETVCALPVEREWQGEMTLLFPLMFAPEHKSLAEISAWLSHFKEEDPMRVGATRKYLRFGRLPWPIRRFAVWHSLHCSGTMRARRFGTSVVSSVGDLACEQIDVITPLTSYFTFGPIDENGQVRMTIVYDHRVMDGRCVARCLNSIEQILNEEVLYEIRQQPATPRPFRAPGQEGMEAA